MVARHTVPKTSGQGTSRYSSKLAHELKGGGPAIKGPGATDRKGGRSYAKSGNDKMPEVLGGASFGATLPNWMPPENKTKSSVKFGEGKTKRLK